MIYLSAQPDTEYFIWQLEVLIDSFKVLNIQSKDIHILVAYNPQVGKNKAFQNFVKNNESFARFFYYPDRRIKKQYISTIRPHIIKQHFAKYSYLVNEVIFYHDSDILFTSTVGFEDLCDDEVWYFSDTSGYMNVGYLRNRRYNIVEEMCEIINIPIDIIIENDNNCGGAQSILKKVDYNFWSKIEEDSHKLYTFLSQNEERFKKEFLDRDPLGTFKPVPAWCADMWALLWNSYMLAEVKTSKHLDFSWPIYPVSEWSKHNIFHNAGIDESFRNKYFYKGDFRKYAPYFYNFDFVSPETCSYKYIERIKNIYRNKKIDLSQLTIVIVGNDEDRIKVAYEYLEKSAVCKLCVLGKEFSSLKEISFTTEIVVFYDSNCISDISMLFYMYNTNRNESIFCHGFSIDHLMKPLQENFAKLKDISLLYKYSSIRKHFIYSFSAISFHASFLNENEELKSLSSNDFAIKNLYLIAKKHFLTKEVNLPSRISYLASEKDLKNHSLKKLLTDT